MVSKSMARWLIQCGEPFQLLLTLMHERLLESPVIHCDEAHRIEARPASESNKPFVIGRKAWLFSDTLRGAAARAQIYSLVEAAKIDGQEPCTWLPHAQSVAD